MPFKKLKGRIVEVYGSISALADYLGVSRQVLTKKVNGQTKMTLEDVEVFVNALRIPTAEIPVYFFINHVT